MLYNTPLSAELYRQFTDIKYGPEPESVIGWALRDNRGRTLAWHPRETATPTWASADAAYRAFVPDGKKRHNLALLGWTVAQTQGIDDMCQVLHAARGDATDPVATPTETMELI